MMKALLLALTSLTTINAHANLVPRYHVSAGSSHTCALDNDGIKCWGDNRYGEADIPPLSHPTQVSAGSGFTCAIDEDKVKCWGDNSMGQLYIPRLNHPSQVATGSINGCAIDRDGVKCWSRRGFHFQSPLNAPDVMRPIQISVGHAHACVLDANGIRCWGLRESGQCDVPALNRPTQVSAGAYHTCALDQDGVKCWGGRFLRNKRRLRNVPSLNHPMQITSGGDHACALDADGVKCWGSNDSGQLNVPRLNHPTQVDAGRQHTCAIDQDGVKCWGNNEQRQANAPSLHFSSSHTLRGTRLFLAELAPHVYSFDQQYLSGLATLLSEPHGFETTVHRFALLALAPHLKNFGYVGQSQDLIEAEFETPAELGDSLANLSRPGAPTLASLDRTPELARLAIRMLSISIQTALPVLSESQKQQAPMMLTLLANALSGESASSRELLQRSLPDLERFFTEMSHNSYLRGRAASGLALLEYLVNSRQ